MVERAHLRRVEVDAGRLVRHDRAVVPAIPEALHDVDELLRDLVAQVVLHVSFAAEVERGLGRRARHHVPGCPPLGDVVEGAEGAGDVVGLAEAGRHGGAEAEVPRRGAQHRDERGRLEPAEKRRVIAGVHDEPVGHEQEIELAALGLPGDLLDDRQVVVAGGGAVVAPARRMIAGAEHEHAEVHLAPHRRHGPAPVLG
jgi:hypothetical protein